MNAKSTLSPYKKTARQLLSYALIGVLINLSGYSFYLILTYSGGTPKLTMSAMYAIGVVLSYFANRKFTFRHDGHIGATSIRFMIAYALGYMLNMLLLVMLVDWMGFPHQIVQAVAIVVVAVLLFFLSRIFVFSQHPLECGERRP
jgi:putative flippase GtrA